MTGSAKNRVSVSLTSAVGDTAITRILVVFYNTIRDAILTGAQKLTQVSLIYRMEPTTKSGENEKLKSKKRIC